MVDSFLGIQILYLRSLITETILEIKYKNSEDKVVKINHCFIVYAIK